MYVPLQSISDKVDMGDHFFRYGRQETDYLKRKDKRMAELIERVGMVRRPVIPDLFEALVHSIVGQQISTKAHATVWARLQQRLGSVDALSVLSLSSEQLRSLGLSCRKVGYIRSIAEKVQSGALDFHSLSELSDAEVIQRLTALDGVGVWTAEMLLLHSLQRSDVLSFGDLGIHRGLRLLYHHREMPRARFERYRCRYSPYGSVASIYLWALAAGEVEPW